MKRLAIQIFAMVAMTATGSSALAKELLSDILKREMPVTDESLAQCKLATGQAIEEARCADWKRKLASAYADEATEHKQLAYVAAANTAYEQARADESQAKKQRETQWSSDRAARQEQHRERMAANERQRAAEEAREATADKRAAQTESVKKERCGGDYKKPSIGMTMARVRECVSPSFKLSGQVNTAQGIVTTYKAPGGYLHVIEDKVVQWGYLRQ